MSEKQVPSWGPAEADASARLVQLALAEDLGEVGDRTSALLPSDLQGQAAFVARASGIVAGLPAVVQVYEALDPNCRLTRHTDDGQVVRPGDVVATIAGPMRAILTGERTALNFLQRLSGVATLTRRFVDAIAGLPCVLLDTRKTTPGWRSLEKYGVRCGGCCNHRVGLFDGVMFKDNHLAALSQRAAGFNPAGGFDAIAHAVQLARSQVPAGVPIEVEVESLEQLDQALVARPDVILLDNMNVVTLREAVRRRNMLAPNVRLEASGGVTLATVRAIAETGVDCISVGALTHSAPALDIALDYRR